MSRSEPAGDVPGTVARFERNVRANLIRFALTGPVTLLVVREIHRALPAAEFGLWAILSLPAANFYLFDMGGQLALTRLVAGARGRGAPEEAGPLTGSLATFYAVLSGMAAVALLVAWKAGWVPRPVPLVLALAATAVGLAGIPVQAQLAGHERLDLVNLWMGAATVVHAALAVAVAPWGVDALMGAQILANGVALAGVVLSATAACPWPGRLAPARVALEGLLGEMMAVWPSQLHGVLVMHGDKLILGAMSGLAAAGQMDMVGRLPGYVRFLAIKVADPLLPAAARLVPEGGHEALAGLLGAGLARTVWVWMLAATGLCVFAPEILTLWLGNAPVPVVFGLRCVAASFAVQSLPTLLWYYWTGAGQRRFAIAYVLCGAALWLIGALAGAWTAGVAGAAVAHLVSSACVTMVALAATAGGLPPGTLARLGRALARATPACAVAAGLGMAALAVAGPLAGLAAYAAVAGASLAWFGRPGG